MPMSYKNLFFISLALVIVLIGYAILRENNNQGRMSVANESTLQDKKFDLDISSLSYQLPRYTKICLPESRYDCSSSGCEKNKPTTFVLYDENTSKVYRCDSKPCDSYDVSREVSGLYTNLTPITPNGSLVKLSSVNEYVESVSLGLDTIIYRGRCSEKE